MQVPLTHVPQDASQWADLVHLLPHGATQRPASEQMLHSVSVEQSSVPVQFALQRVGGANWHVPITHSPQDASQKYMPEGLHGLLQLATQTLWRLQMSHVPTHSSVHGRPQPVKFAVDRGCCPSTAAAKSSKPATRNHTMSNLTMTSLSCLLQKVQREGQRESIKNFRFASQTRAAGKGRETQSLP